MERALRWVLPVLVMVEIALVWLDALSLRDAVLIVVSVEVLLLIVGGRQLLVALSRYRAGRGSGLDPWRSFEDGLAVLLPRKAARMAVLEPRLWVCLVRWISRRTGTSDREFGYHKRSALRLLVPLVVFTSPVELVVVHLLAHAFSPWGWVKWALLAVGIYAVLWLLGLYASIATMPHGLEEEGLRLRYGVLAEGLIPYAEIEEVLRTARKAPGSGEGLQHVPEEDALYLAAGGRTDLTLRLTVPRTLDGFLRRSEPATTVHLAADEPEKLARALRERIGEAAHSQPPALARSKW